MKYTMIPKKEMKDGAWYLGNCRNANMARWDEKLDRFVHLRFKFGWMVDIEHFEDVKESRCDGFIPVKEIETLDYELMGDLLKEVGY